MALSTQGYKGTRDFYPEDKRIQKYIFSKLREVVESFGYQEYDAPLLESLDIYAAKSGDEIVNEQLYSFQDKKGRKLAIRPEMTPSVSRMVAARRQELPYPLRWYSLPNLWRYERPQAGRLREHWQLNVDIFGVEGIEADYEIILVADSILKAFGAETEMYAIKINSRQLMSKLLDNQGIKGESQKLAMRYLDNYRKLENDKNRKEFLHKAAKNKDEPLKIHKAVGAIAGKDGSLQTAVKGGEDSKKLRELWQMLDDAGVKTVIDPFISRGLDYYTDIVFEVFDTDPENARAIAGGGRYDGLVGLFGVDPVPTVGFAIGDVTLQKFLELHGLLPELKPETDAGVILIGDVFKDADKMVTKLREAGARLAVDTSSRKLDAQLRSAVKSGVSFVIFIGEEEIAASNYKVRNLKNGEELALNAAQTAETLKSRR
jgi:histidyl-tRNA synthetase